MAKSQHGGKRPGAGRPRLPDAERRDQIVSIVFTRPELELITRAAAGERHQWARGVLLRAARDSRT